MKSFIANCTTRAVKITLLILLALNFSAIPGSAYSTNGKYWAGGTIWYVTVEYKWGSNLSGPSQWRTAFESAISDWNAQAIRPELSEDSTNGVLTLNTYWDQFGALGVATYPAGAGAFTWCNASGNTYPGKSTTANQRRSTSGHEIGHCLGLSHTTVSNALMKTGRNRDAIYAPKSDDVDGITSIYGCPGGGSC